MILRCWHSSMLPQLISVPAAVGHCISLRPWCPSTEARWLLHWAAVTLYHRWTSIELGTGAQRVGLTLGCLIHGSVAPQAGWTSQKCSICGPFDGTTGLALDYRALWMIISEACCGRSQPLKAGRLCDREAACGEGLKKVLCPLKVGIIHLPLPLEHLSCTGHCYTCNMMTTVSSTRRSKEGWRLTMQ